MPKKGTFAQEVRDFDGDVYLVLPGRPGTPNKFVKVDKEDLAKAGDHHGDMWMLCKVGDKAVVEPVPTTSCP